MTISKIVKGLVLTLLVATSAFAGNKGSLKVDEPVEIDGKQLTPGEYQLKWEGTGPVVELNIIKSNKVVATVPARLVQTSGAGKQTGYVTQIADDGHASMTEIRFSGKKYQLAIGQDSAASEASKDSGEK
jgi:hypothetical protein